MKRSLILILFLIPVVFSFEYDDDLDYKRYSAAYEYIINSTELDSFYAEYNVEEPERTFCLSKMIESFTYTPFLFDIINFEFGIEIPDKPSQLTYDNPGFSHYKEVRDSLIVNEDSSYILEYVDFSKINNNEMNCNFKIYFSVVDKDRLIVDIPLGYRNYHVHDIKNVYINSYIGITFLIYFLPDSDSIRKVFSYTYIRN